MWNSTPGLKQLMRTLDRRTSNPNRSDVTLPQPSNVPDLLGDNDNLREITRIRDALRYLRTDARSLDRESESPTRNCEEDLERFCVLLCGRIIGGQKRELTGNDRVFPEQVTRLASRRWQPSFDPDRPQNWTPLFPSCFAARRKPKSSTQTLVTQLSGTSKRLLAVLGACMAIDRGNAPIWRVVLRCSSDSL